MIGQELKLIFKGDKAYLTDEKSLGFDKLKPSFNFSSFASEVFWIIRVLNYIPNEQRLFVEVLSYNSGVTEFSEKQLGLSPILLNIREITFKSINTAGLLKSSLNKDSISSTTGECDSMNPEIVEESDLFGYYHEIEDVFKKQIYDVADPKLSNTRYVKKPFLRVIEDSFYFLIKDLRFIAGGVSFEKRIKGYYEPIEFNIINYDIRAEFDAIKNYFSNVLKTKKIYVNVKVELSDDNIIKSEASSPEIERINSELIDNVKFEYVERLRKNVLKIEVDKSLFTMDEFFDTFSDEKLNSKTFYETEKDLLDDLLKITNTKHYKNLRFLSSKHAHEIMRLRFVHRPFSFIFLIAGEKHYHIIWETLDTKEATYIWHIQKDLRMLKQTLRKIEDIINVIKVQGKTAYINSNEDQFRRIYHDYSEFIDGFIKWKGELESYLT